MEATLNMKYILYSKVKMIWLGDEDLVAFNPKDARIFEVYEDAEEYAEYKNNQKNLGWIVKEVDVNKMVSFPTYKQGNLKIKT